MNLTFRWDALRRESVYSPRVPGGRDLLLGTGQAARLDQLHQYPTYAGRLCGVPYGSEDHENQIAQAIECAARVFSITPEGVFVSPPVLQVARLRRPAADGGWKEYDVEYLPPVCSLGLLLSGPVHDPHEDGSQAAIVWFQDAFGLPDPHRLEEAAKTMPWAAIAEDWGW